MLKAKIELNTIKCLCGEVLVFSAKTYETCPKCNQTYNAEGKEIRYNEYINGKYEIDLIPV